MNEQSEKKGFTITIAGFTFGKKTFILVGVVAVCIMISLAVSASKKRAEEAKAQQAAEEAARMAAMSANQGSSEPEVLDIHDEIQRQLRNQYGEPPEGFEWGYTGELVSLGNDDDSSCEDVVYMFVRALSILDFSTAERYSSNSSVVASYKRYYGEISDQIINYYNNFLRKQFKESLSSIEINKVEDTAVFSDGTQYVTLNVSVLDLTDKDFWVKDKKKLWKQLRVYRETEDDTTKLEQYVYDYIYDAYEKGRVKKKDYMIELVAAKDNGMGWLISGDGELDAVLQYKNGVDVAKYILDAFDDWYQKTTLKEQLDEISKKQERNRAKAKRGTSK